MSRFASIPPDAPSAKTRGSDFWLHDGVLLGRTRAAAPHGELDDAVDAVDKLRRLTGGSPRPLVFDARHVGWLQFAAREHVHRHAAELFTRAAVIVKPAMARALKYALVGLGNTSIPIEIVDNEEAAWRFVNEMTVP